MLLEVKNYTEPLTVGLARLILAGIRKDSLGQSVQHSLRVRLGVFIILSSLRESFSFKLKNVRILRKVSLITVFFLVLIFFLTFFMINLPYFFPENSPYSHTSILLEALSQVTFLPVLVIPLAPIVIFSSRIDWSSVGSPTISTVVLVLIALLVWTVGLDEFNYYYNHGYWLDRSAFIILGILCYFHPVFFGPFLIIGFLLFSQTFSVTYHPESLKPLFFDDVLPLYQLSIMFLAYLYLQTFWNMKREDLLFGWLCALGGNYFYPGWLKLKIGTHPLDWVLHYRLHYSYANIRFLTGWTTFLPEIYQEGLYQLFSVMNRPLLICVVVFELLGLLVLFGKKIAQIHLVAAVVFHAGVFIAFGIFFWKWIFAACLLIYILNNLTKRETKNLFTNSNFLLSLPVILLMAMSFGRSYTWWETPYSLRLRVEAVTQQQKRYSVPFKIFGPYKTFFENLYSRPELFDTKLPKMTTRDREYQQKMNQRMSTPDGALRAIEELGVNPFNHRQAGQLRELILTSMKNRLTDRTWIHETLDQIAPPPRYYTYDDRTVSPIEEIPSPITSLEITLHDSYFDGTKYHTLRRRTLYRIPFEDPRFDGIKNELQPPES